MTDLRRSPLGHATTWAEGYDAGLLFPVDRAPLRDELGLSDPLPFRGVDVWNCYELSWLDPLLSMLIAVFIVYSAYRLLREAADVLLETVPPDIDPGDVLNAMRAVSAVVERDALDERALIDAMFAHRQSPHVTGHAT